jgi:hypothetical protein
MHTVLSVVDADCLEAVRRYADVLSASGLPVRLEETAVDDGWTQETAVSIEWGPAEQAADQGGFEEDDDLGDDEGAVRPSQAAAPDDGRGRLAEHYLRNMQFLARNAQAARAWNTSPWRSKKPR